MRARWRWPCVSLALLLAYTVGSLLFLSPPRDPVGAITGASGASTTWAPRIRSAAGVDSIVFIALGPAARSASLLYALSSLREEGRWDGPVHVIVEREGDLDCLSSHLRSGVTTIAVVPPDGGDGGGGGGGGGGADDSDDGDETKAGTSDRKGELARKEERGSGGGGGGRRRRGGGGGGVGGDGAGGNSAEGGGVAINAKLIKMQLFDLLPASVQRVVYVDCDVITQRPLGPYLAAVAREWGDVDEKAAAIVGAAVTVEEAATARVKNQEVAVLPAGASSSLRAQEGRAIEGPRLPPISFPPPAAEAAAADTPASRASPAAASAAAAAAAGTKGGTAAAAAAAAADGVPSTLLIFPDAGGHKFPVCAGCDVAHSGVVALARGHSELCLQLWHDAFVGKTGGGGGSGGGVRGGGGVGGGGDNAGTATDQEALDIALRKGSGCEARWVDRGHLHFMKDLFVMAGLTRTSTFAHFTGLLHPERLSSFYRRHYEWSLGRSVDEWGQGEIRACAAGW